MLKNQKLGGASDLEDEEIEYRDGVNDSAVYMEGNDRPKNQGNGEMRYYFISRNFSPFMFFVCSVILNL